MSGTPQNPAASEWLKVMTEEVARKREEAERARREQALREAERAAAVSDGQEADGSRAPTASSRPRRRAPR